MKIRMAPLGVSALSTMCLTTDATRV
jgi:hypothetical protein